MAQLAASWPPGVSGAESRARGMEDWAMPIEMPIEVFAAESTELFTGSIDEPLQIVRVSHRGCSSPTPVRIEGPGLQTIGESTAQPGGASLEVAVRVAGPVAG